MNHNRIIGIELFAGCGGLSTRFLDAGLAIASGFEIDRRAVDAYNYNHGHRGSHGFVTDLSTLSGKTLLEFAGLRSVDFVVGGPPCQPFSIVGKRLGAADERADLMTHFVRLICELSPKAFVLENVPNLEKLGGGVVFKETTSGLAELGYSLWHNVLSAADFGVPQARKRLILIGIKGRQKVRGPEASHGGNLRPYVTTREAIGDLPDAANSGSPASTTTNQRCIAQIWSNACVPLPKDVGSAGRSTTGCIPIGYHTLFGPAAGTFRRCGQSTTTMIVS